MLSNLHPLFQQILATHFDATATDPETVRVCSHCYEEIQRVGEDLLNYCECCQQVEGDTVRITLAEYEARRG